MAGNGVQLEVVKKPEQSDFAADAMASVVVFLVALPLCMGIAIASGRPAAAGIITGIVGGLLVGTLAGCPLQVSGPAAGLSVIVYELNRAHGGTGLAVVIVLAGLIQLVAGMLGSGQLFRAVPPAVIHGMLAGIGVLIFASQSHIMVDDVPKGSGLSNLLAIPGAVMKSLVQAEGTSHQQAAMLGVLTLIVLIAWSMAAPRRLKLIPAPLVALGTASVVAYLWTMKVQYVNVPESLVAAAEPLPLSAWQMALRVDTWLSAMAVAVVASAETLLAAGAVDRLHDGPRTQYDRELMAQGLGNTICGFAGGLPMTGAIVRSKANVDAGGRTRASAILHGVWLLAAVVLLPGLLRLVPIASLAGLLVYIGFKLVNPEHMKDLARHAKAELGIYMATLVTVVCTDLLKGVIVGIILSAVKLLWTLSHLGVDLVAKHGHVVLRVEGVATFLLLPRLAARLDEVPPGSTLELDSSQLDYVDHACIELIHEWAERHRSTGGTARVNWDELSDLSAAHRRWAARAAAAARLRLRRGRSGR